MSVIKRADWLIEIGPEGGSHGGQVMFAGTPQQLLASDDQITKPYMS
jgi:excinuclease UvrABC ATPase subunit